MISGKTKTLGIIGYSVEHSLSPIMQNEAIAAAGIDYVYVPLPIKPEDLTEAFHGIQKIGFQGFNVTVPHKVNIMPLLDDISESARHIGAVNTVIHRNGKWIGDNTDSIGFINSLKKNHIKIQDTNAIVLGAGGAARAVIWGLIENGIKSITLFVRNIAKAQQVVDLFSQYLTIQICDWNQKEQTHNYLKVCNLLINSTPLGMSSYNNQMPPVDWKWLAPDAVAYDLIYTPAITPFLKMAKENGHQIFNGEEMLIEQGIAAFKIWTNIMPDYEIMKESLRKILNH